MVTISASELLSDNLDSSWVTDSYGKVANQNPLNT